MFMQRNLSNICISLQQIMYLDANILQCHIITTMIALQIQSSLITSNPYYKTLQFILSYPALKHEALGCCVRICPGLLN